MRVLFKDRAWAVAITLGVHGLCLLGLCWLRMPQLPMPTRVLSVEWVQLVNETPKVAMEPDRVATSASPPVALPSGQPTKTTMLKPTFSSSSINHASHEPSQSLSMTSTTELTAVEEHNRLPSENNVFMGTAISEKPPENQSQDTLQSLTQSSTPDLVQSISTSHQSATNSIAQATQHGDQNPSTHTQQHSGSLSNTQTISNNANNNHSHTASSQDWQAQVCAKLQRYLRYPKQALAKSWSGTAVLSITVDKQGNVLSVVLVRSSGKALLDDEAIATAKRASPLPEPPDAILQGASSRRFEVPLVFDAKSHR